MRDTKRKAEAEAAEAEDYAQALLNAQWVRPDWAALNARIVDEFGLAGLRRIKRAAWKRVEEPKPTDSEVTP